MPIYTFEDTLSGKVHEDLMSICSKELYLEKNPHIRQLPTALNIVSGISGKTHKTDDGWKENLARMGEAQPNTPLGERYGSKSIKDVKTRQAVDKWRKKRAADKNK